MELMPLLVKGPLTLQEEYMLVLAHSLLGNK